MIRQRNCTVKLDDDDESRAKIAHFFDESDATPDEANIPPAIRKFLTDIFVFFAYMDNNPAMITAATLIDDPSCPTPALRLAVATNSGEFNDTESTLEKVCGAFRGVIQLLDKQLHSEMDLAAVQTKLLKILVALAREKITWHFRLVHTCAAGKVSGAARKVPAKFFKLLMTFLEHWDSSLHDTNNNDGPPGMLQHVERLRHIVNEFHPLFDNPPKDDDTLDDLLIRALLAVGKFVCQLHGVGMGVGVDKVVEDFLNVFLCDTDKDAKINFARRFIALGWYGIGTAFLCNLAAGKVHMNNAHAQGQAAIKWPSGISVVPVKLPIQAYGIDEGHASVLTATTTTTTTEAVEPRWQPKMHAEFQLMVYLSGLYPDADLESRSFYISSFKKPCVLCYAFMTLFPNVHCPRSHGTLYNLWRTAAVDFLAQQAKPVLKCCARLQTLLQQTVDTHSPDQPCSSPSRQHGRCEELELRMHPAIDKKMYWLASH